jgi:hypothetical protein
VDCKVGGVKIHEKTGKLRRASFENGKNVNTEH